MNDTDLFSQPSLIIFTNGMNNFEHNCRLYKVVFFIKHRIKCTLTFYLIMQSLFLTRLCSHYIE